MQKVRVGIIGLAHLHAVSYLPHVQQCEATTLVAVSDPEERLLTQKQSEFPAGTKLYSDYKRLIIESGAECLLIFAPHYLCPEICEFAASQGKHFIVEKPMAASLAGGECILKAASEHGVIGSTPYVWRYHLASQEIKRHIEAGYLGQIQGLEGRCIAGRIHRYIEGNSQWMLSKKQAGGGPMWNLGVHWIDLFGWLMDGVPVDRVYAEYSSFSPNLDIEENGFGIVHYCNGASATLNIGYSAPRSFPYGRDLHINIRGTLGSITWNPAFEDTEDEIFVSSEHPDLADAPNRSLRFLMKKVPGYTGMLGLNYFTEFVKCVQENKTPAVTIQDGVEALRVVDALNRSAEEHEVIVL